MGRLSYNNELIINLHVHYCKPVSINVSIFLQDLMPITDQTSKALLNFSGGQDGHLTPTFPSFLPLEIFDNTEFDCRTPEEWLALGIYTYIRIKTRSPHLWHALFDNSPLPARSAGLHSTIIWVMVQLVYHTYH